MIISSCETSWWLQNSSCSTTSYLVIILTGRSWRFVTSSYSFTVPGFVTTCDKGGSKTAWRLKWSAPLREVWPRNDRPNSLLAKYRPTYPIWVTFNNTHSRVEWKKSEIFIRNSEGKLSLYIRSDVEKSDQHCDWSRGSTTRPKLGGPNVDAAHPRPWPHLRWNTSGSPYASTI